VKQCSLLIVNGSDRGNAYEAELEKRGFRVVMVNEWPPDHVVLDAEVVVVVLRTLESVGMLAARMRAKPRFGRRILIALAPAVTADERRLAIAAGFDDAVAESAALRVLIARILRILRTRPEHRCFLPDLRRPAA
jgi:DNA-binding response OmpR family regulator